MGKNATERLAFEIADDSARAAIESYGYERGLWWAIRLSGADAVQAAQVRQALGCAHDEETEQRDLAEKRDLNRAVRYLELRGKLKRHPDEPDLVQVCE